MPIKQIGAQLPNTGANVSFRIAATSSKAWVCHLLLILVLISTVGTSKHLVIAPHHATRNAFDEESVHQLAVFDCSQRCLMSKIDRFDELLQRLHMFFALQLSSEGLQLEQR